MPGPFEGLRVIDLSTVILGPFATQLLGDMGAEVVKVEAPGGDQSRLSGPSRTPGMSSNFMQVNRNKRGIVLDLKAGAGAEALRRLIRTSDVFVSNIRPEPLRRLGFDYASVRDLKPDILYCSIVGFGRDGPYAGRPAYDDIIQGAAGMVALETFAGGPARFMPSLIADKTTGLFAAYAIASALFHRLATGEGQEIEVPMFESMVSFMMLEHLCGASFIPAKGRVGSERHATPLRWPHPTKDGHICALPSSDKHWQTLFDIAGRDDLKDDPIFASRKSRKANLRRTMEILSEILATRTTAEWAEALAEGGIPCMPISSLDEVVSDPHLAEVGFWHEVEHPSEGHIRLMNPPYALGASPASVRRPPPAHGEHTRAILAELGYDDAAIDRMIAEQAALSAD